MSTAEELRELVAAKEQDLARLHEEYDEFQHSSKELEEELERDAKNAEERAAKLQHRTEELQDKLSAAQGRVAELTAQLGRAQEDLAAMQSKHTRTLTQMRALEQSADSFEQNERRAQAEASRAREQLEMSIEKHQFAEAELEDLRRETMTLTERQRAEMLELREELSLVTPLKIKPPQAQTAAQTSPAATPESPGVNGGSAAWEGRGRLAYSPLPETFSEESSPILASHKEDQLEDTAAEVEVVRLRQEVEALQLALAQQNGKGSAPGVDIAVPISPAQQLSQRSPHITSPPTTRPAEAAASNTRKGKCCTVS